MDNESIGRWLFDSTTESASTFRICDNCGEVYRINSGDGPYKYCPNCGQQKKEKEEAK